MQSSTPFRLVVIVTVAILAIWMSLVDIPEFLGRPIKAQTGLDIQGGLRVLMEAEPGIPVTAEAMERAKGIIERRVNALGVAEPRIQVSGSNRVVVELPGVRDPKQAVDLIKQTGLLEFVDFSKPGTCTAQLPPEGTYIYTTEQEKLRSGGVTPTPTVTATLASGITATAQVTATGTVVSLTTPTAAATVSATLVPTTAVPATAIPATETPLPPSATPAPPTNTIAPTNTTAPTTSARLNDSSRAIRYMAQATTEPTAQPTVQPTAATNAAITPTGSETPAGTPAGSVTPGTPGPTPTVPFARDGASRERGALNPCTGQPFVTAMTGGGLKDAYAAAGGGLANEWVVNFSIQENEEGRKFGPFTASHINQQMAIVLDGQVISAPVIQARLDTGGVISGQFDQQSSRDLALTLRYGALPIPLRIVSEEQVGASLGAESIAATGRAGVLSIVVILLYLILYYRLPGLMAALALLVFIAVNFALFKYIPVTITLPALVGFFIGIGNAIDGNVLTFERIKEELRFGASLDQAIRAGYDRAWSSIRDSNLSTAIFGFIMFYFGGQFGASAVRGFAVTLLLGLLLNIFTSLFVTRAFLDVLLALFGARFRENPSALFKYRK